MKENLAVAIAVFIKDVTDESFKVWTQIRLEPGALYGLFEFPGGKIESGESPEEALRREVLEEVGVIIPSDSKVVLFKYQDYSSDNISEDKNFCLYTFVSIFKELPEGKGKWLEIKYKRKYKDKTDYLKGKIPPINHVILDNLAVYIQTQHQAKVLDYLWIM